MKIYSITGSCKMMVRIMATDLNESEANDLVHQLPTLSLTLENAKRIGVVLFKEMWDGLCEYPDRPLPFCKWVDNGAGSYSLCWAEDEEEGEDYITVVIAEVEAEQLTQFCGDNSSH